MVERVHRSRMTALPWMTPLPWMTALPWMTPLSSKVKNEITPEQNMLQIPKSNLSFLPLMVPDLVYICQMLYLKQNLNY